MNKKIRLSFMIIFVTFCSFACGIFCRTVFFPLDIYSKVCLDIGAFLLIYREVVCSDAFGLFVSVDVAGSGFFWWVCIHMVRC